MCQKKGSIESFIIQMENPSISLARCFEKTVYTKTNQSDEFV